MLKHFDGKHTQNGSKSQRIVAKRYMYFWIAFMCVVNALVSLYEILIKRKEIIVRITLGANLNVIVLKNIVFDSLIYIALFSFTLFLFSFVISLGLFIARAYLTVFLVAAINAAFYFSLYCCDIRKVFSKMEISTLMLIPSYIIKSVVCILALTFSALAVKKSVIAFNLESEKLYYESFKEYYNIGITLRAEKMTNVNQVLIGLSKTYDKFYKHFDELFETTILHIADTNSRIMFANARSKAFLEERINEIKDFNSDNMFVFILPEKKVSDEDIARLKYHVKKEFSLDDNIDYDIIYYTQKVKLPSLGSESSSNCDVVNNPLIIYINQVQSQTVISSSRVAPLSMSGHPNYAYKLDYELFQKYAAAESFYTEYKVAFQNIYNKYLTELSKAYREMTFSLINAIVLFFLNFLLSGFTIKIRYRAKAMEIAVLKVLGCSIGQRHKSVFAVSALIFLLVLPTYCYISVVHIKLPLSLLFVLFSIFHILETGFLVHYLLWYERRSIIRTLKGGTI